MTSKIKYFTYKNGVFRLSKIDEELNALREALDRAKECLSVVGACDNAGTQRVHGLSMLESVKRIESKFAKQARNGIDDSAATWGLYRKSSETDEELTKRILDAVQSSPMYKEATNWHTPQNNDLSIPTSCQHSWKVYDSGFSRYDYCEKCDKKKE